MRDTALTIAAREAIVVIDIEKQKCRGEKFAIPEIISKRGGKRERKKKEKKKEKRRTNIPVFLGLLTVVRGEVGATAGTAVLGVAVLLGEVLLRDILAEILALLLGHRRFLDPPCDSTHGAK